MQTNVRAFGCSDLRRTEAAGFEESPGEWWNGENGSANAVVELRAIYGGTIERRFDAHPTERMQWLDRWRLAVRVVCCPMASREAKPCVERSI